MILKNLGYVYIIYYYRLTDVLHKNLKLTMVFEYIDQVLYTTKLKVY